MTGKSLFRALGVLMTLTVASTACTDLVECYFPPAASEVEGGSEGRTEMLNAEVCAEQGGEITSRRGTVLGV